MDLEVFDIETGALSSEEVLLWTKPFAEFDADSVKLGNIKDADKIKEKIEAERQKHLEERDLYYRNALEKAALDPKTGYVVAIGLMDKDGETEILSGAEADILEEFWSMTRYSLSRGRKLAGWNIEMFDLPFLLRRSWKHGVQVPFDAYSCRRWNAGFIDLMKVWTFGEYKEFEKLDTVARFLGFEGKNVEGASGAIFSKLWNGTLEERALALEYLKNDVLQTRLVAEKILGLRSKITQLQENKKLITHMKNDEIKIPIKGMTDLEFKVWALYALISCLETVDTTKPETMLKAVSSELDMNEESVEKGFLALIKKGFFNVENVA